MEGYKFILLYTRRYASIFPNSQSALRNSDTMKDGDKRERERSRQRERRTLQWEIMWNKKELKKWTSAGKLLEG